MDEVTDQPGSMIHGERGDPAPAKTGRQKTGTSRPASWQERLLPLMRSMLVALSAFFFLVTLVQMSYLHWSIFRSPPILIDSASGLSLFASSNRFEDLYQARQFEIRAAMERYIVEKRYHQISVQLMSGVWLRYMGFITGMILAMVGASFILGKMRVTDQEMEGKYAGVSLSLRSTSPGIILAVLGVILMFATLVDKDVYEVEDANIYLSVFAPLSTLNPAIEGVLPTLPDISGDSILP
jgi:hypothetical protein